MKIVVLFLFLVPFAVVGAPLPTDNATSLEKFTSNVRNLLRFAGGIHLQSSLSIESFPKITSIILKYNSSFVKNIINMQPQKISEEIMKIAEKSSNVTLGNEFDMLEYGMSAFKTLFEYSELIKNGIDSNKVDEFIVNFGPTLLGENLSKLKMLSEMRFPLTLLKCLEENAPAHRLQWCINLFHKLTNTLQSFEDTADNFIDLGTVQEQFKFAENFYRDGAIIKALSATVKSVEMISKNSGQFLNIRTTLDLFREVFKAHFDEILQSLEGEHLGQKIDDFIYSVKYSPSKKPENWEKGLPHPHTGLKKLFDALEGKWMKQALSIGKQPKRLEKGLLPLKKYSQEIIRIRNLTREWRLAENMSDVFSVKDTVEHIEKWMSVGKFEGHYDIPYHLLEPFTKCLKEIPKFPSSISIQKFSGIVGKLEEIIKLIKGASEIVEVFHKSYKMLNSASDTLLLAAKSHLDAINNTDEQKKIQDAFRNVRRAFLETEGLERLRQLEDLTNIVNEKLGEDFEKIDTIVADLPDNLDILTKTATALKGNSIFPLFKCSAQYKKSFNTLVTIMDGAKSLADFANKSEKIEVFKRVMKDAVKVQKMLEKVEEIFKSSDDGKEVQKVKQFGKDHDLVSTFSEAVISLEDMKKALSRNNTFHTILRSNVDESKGEFPKKWERRGKEQLKELVKELATLEKYIGQNGGNGLKGVERVFTEASKMKGVTISWEGLDDYMLKIKFVNPDLAGKFKDLSQLQLNFASFSGNFHAASLSTTVLEKFLVDLENEDEKEQVVHWTEEFPIWTVVFLVLGVVLLLLILAAIAIFLSPYGRGQWKKYYLRRYGSQDEIELFWRYSYWIDQEAEKNALCEAVREINYDHVKAIVERGAFINVYNSFGNTPLHAATKYGHVKIVEILLKNGADRNAFNFENRTAEQLLDESSGMSTTTQLKSETTVRTMKREKAFEEIETLFLKYQNKVFKPRIPDLLPTMAFRIRIDSRIKKNSAAIFTERYKGNVTDQVAGVTHLIVPTDKNGVLVSDDFDYVMCVFLPTLMMQEQWMRACLEKKNNFRDDYKFRVEKVRYKGKEYGTVLKWAQWIHKQTLPYLFGVQLHLCAEVGESVGSQLRQLVEMHGATWCEEVPIKEQYNVGSHPFHHFHLGPLFVIHSNNVPSMEHLKNDELYTLMTFDEFIIFMLQMDVKYDKMRRMPIPVKSIDDITTGRGVSTKNSSTK